MKRKIVVCCEEMLRALFHNLIVFGDGPLYLRSDPDGNITYFKLCPWCGTDLPFPYEEEK